MNEYNGPTKETVKLAMQSCEDGPLRKGCDEGVLKGVELIKEMADSKSNEDPSMISAVYGVILSCSAYLMKTAPHTCHGLAVSEAAVEAAMEVVDEIRKEEWTEEEVEELEGISKNKKESTGNSFSW